MYVAPCMRSAVLPTVALLDASRVRFLLTLWAHGKIRAEALFGCYGGELRSSKLNTVLTSPPDLGAEGVRSGGAGQDFKRLYVPVTRKVSPTDEKKAAFLA